MMGRASWWIALLGAITALVGLWSAWVPHRAAALVLSGWDLAEFVKFLAGTSAVREFFYLPVWCVGLTLTMLAVEPFIGPLKRVVLVALVLSLMFAILPPYPHVFDGYRLAEFRWRFLLGTSGILLVLGLLLASYLPKFSACRTHRTAGAILLLLALVGVVPALWQYLNVRAAIETVYGAALGWGWGLIAFVVGWILVGGIGAHMLLQPRAGSQAGIRDAGIRSTYQNTL